MKLFILFAAFGNIDGDSFPDNIDQCLFWASQINQSCEELEVEGIFISEVTDAAGWTFSDVVVFTGVYRPAFPTNRLDQDSDGTADYFDPCVTVPGIDPLLCTYDRNGDGKVTNMDWRMCKDVDCDLTGDGKRTRADRLIWLEAKRLNIAKGPSCQHIADSSSRLDGVSLCTGLSVTDRQEEK